MSVSQTAPFPDVFVVAVAACLTSWIFVVAAAQVVAGGTSADAFKFGVKTLLSTDVSAASSSAFHTIVGMFVLACLALLGVQAYSNVRQGRGLSLAKDPNSPVADQTVKITWAVTAAVLVVLSAWKWRTGTPRSDTAQNYQTYFNPQNF